MNDLNQTVNFHSRIGTVKAMSASIIQQKEETTMNPTLFNTRNSHLPVADICNEAGEKLTNFPRNMRWLSMR